MRPLELRVRNFRSYHGEHEFDFTDRHLVAIVGPIGSGKSSILDAVVFALYGRTPRLGTNTKALINQRAADAAVSLRFEVEGELWEATRSIRIKGASRHALYRYEDPDGEAVEKLTLEAEVNDKVVDLLGLEYSAFERSVLLAQGRFAEFLQSPPRERDRVLKGVFGHDRVDRMKALAKERSERAGVELDKMSVRMERFDEIALRLETNRNELDEVRQRHQRLVGIAATDAELAERSDAATRTLDELVKRRTMLEEQTVRLPGSEATGRVIAEATSAGKRRVDRARGLEEARQQLQAADEELQKANARDEPARLERAAGLLAAAEPQLKAVVEADRRIKRVGGILDEATKRQESAIEELHDAEHRMHVSLGRAAEAAKILEEAEAALEQGRHANMAVTLRAGLEVEEPCPVCNQIVVEVPEIPEDLRLDELEEVLASARRTKSEMDKAHTDALTDLERARGKVRSADEGVEAAQAQEVGARDDADRARGDLEETNLRLEKILGSGDPSEHLERRKRAYDDLVAARDAAQRRVDQVRGDHDQAILDEQNAAKSLQDLSMRLSDLAARLEVDIEIGDGPEALAEALEALRTSWVELNSSLEAEQGSVESELVELGRQRAELRAGAGITGDVVSAVAVAADRIERLESAIEADDTELGKADELATTRETLQSRVDVFSRINRDLTDARFVRFLLDDERARLSELGSEHFQRLSAGRYRFADDQFAILDLTAADATRRADSLSGGETFLASLGLALALAEMVAGTGGRLDAFFLDEGFGTLDPEHLDLAMEGIETLVAERSDRLVVIVSHVPELRERIGDLIVLERNPVTGDTRVVSD
jgi:exonuclease SbcC